MEKKYGVGFIGSGLVAQSIHVPTLIRLRDDFALRHFMDPDLGTATTVAEPWGAQATSVEADIWADCSVDVVVIGSPDAFHADQVKAAVAAGKKAILCEKPLAVTPAELDEIIAAVEDSDTMLIVGAMHLFDETWQEMQQRWHALPEPLRAIRSSITIPGNDRFTTLAAEVYVPPRTGGGGGGEFDKAAQAGMFTGGVLGLAVHDLVMVHDLAPNIEEFLYAEVFQPFGYTFSFRANGAVVDVIGGTHGHWHTEWTLEAWNESARLRAEFTPSFVHNGSGVGDLLTAQGNIAFPRKVRNGYENEWIRLAQMLSGAGQSTAERKQIYAQARYTAELAQAGKAFILGGAK